MDLLSFSRFPFSARFNLEIQNERIKSELLSFIGGELSPYLEEDDIGAFLRDSIRHANYIIETDSTDGSHLHNPRATLLYLSEIIERLVELTLVRGAETAVSVLDEYCAPEGIHNFCQAVALIDGIKIEKEIPVFKGVRLVPLPSSEISEELARYLPNLPVNAFSDGFIDSTGSFFEKTLLVVDLPGFSLFYKTAADPPFSHGLPIDKLPFQAEVPQLEFSNLNTVSLFKELFCQAVFLACNSPVQLIDGWWFLAEDKSFSPQMSTLTMRGDFNLLESTVEVGEPKIEEVKCLYHILVELHSKDSEDNFKSSEKGKLRIAIDRWIKSNRDDDIVDKMIDLGIALEALYLSDVNDELTFRLRVRAAWYLGKDKEHRKKLLKQFGDIYRGRSNAVHNGKLAETVRFGEAPIPLSDFIKGTQDLCRESIIKILNDKRFPSSDYWDSLIVGGEDEESNI